MLGHDVALYDAREKAGGLNEFGIAAYKSVDDFAQREYQWLLGIGGIELKLGQRLGDQITLQNLDAAYDAVFLGVGLNGVNALNLDGSDKSQVHNAVDFISNLRQADVLGSVEIGRNVVVIGGGMTAVDAAVQSKLLSTIGGVHLSPVSPL